MTPTGDPDSGPSTSRQDAKANSCSVETHPGPSSHAPLQPKDEHAHSQRAAAAAAAGPSPLAEVEARAVCPTLREPARGLAPPHDGAPAHPAAGQASAPAGASGASTRTQEKSRMCAPARDNPQASTSSALLRVQPHPRTQPQPSTSARGPSGTPPSNLILVKTANFVVFPQQPSIGASALITQPNSQLRPHNAPLHRMPGNLIQIETQPMAQAPVQPPHAPHPMPSAVLIAAAPERLGPPQAGHRIILGSQAPGGAAPNPLPHGRAAPPAHGLNIRVLNPNAPAPPAATAPIPRRREDVPLVLAVAPDAGRANPAPGLVAVPPAPEDVPTIEDARPGPSVPRAGTELPPYVRTLLNGVVSRKHHRVPQLRVQDHLEPSGSRNL